MPQVQQLTIGQKAAQALDESIRALREQASACKGHGYSALLDRVADELADLYARQVGPPITPRCGGDDSPEQAASA